MNTSRVRKPLVVALEMTAKLGVDLKLPQTKPVQMFLSTVAEYLNTTIELIIDESVDTIIDDNGSWTGITGLLQKGDADMGAVMTSVRLSKLLAHEFFPTYFYTEVNILSTKMHSVLRVGDILDSIWSIQWKLWLMLIISIFMSSLLCYLCDHLIVRQRRGLFRNYVGTFMAFLIYQGSTGRLRHMRALSGRIMIGCIWCVAIVLGIFFGATIRTRLVTEDDQSTVRSINDLFKKEDTEVFISHISETRQVLEEARFDVMSPIWNRVSDFDIVDKTTSQLCQDKLLIQHFLHGTAVLMDRDAVLTLCALFMCMKSAAKLNLFLSRKSIMDYLVAYPYRKTLDSNIKDRLRKLKREMFIRKEVQEGLALSQ